MPEEYDSYFELLKLMEKGGEKLANKEKLEVEKKEKKPKKKEEKPRRDDSVRQVIMSHKTAIISMPSDVRDKFGLARGVNVKVTSEQVGGAEAIVIRVLGKA